MLSRRTLVAAIGHINASVLCPVPTSRAIAAGGACLKVVAGRSVDVPARVEPSLAAGRAGLGGDIEAVAAKAVEPGNDFATASEEDGLVDVDLGGAGLVDVPASLIVVAVICVAAEGALHDLDGGTAEINGSALCTAGDRKVT